MKLSDLHAQFTQIIPLATGIYTGLTFVCRNDPNRKRGHGVLFDKPINPYGAEFDASLSAALNANDSWRAQPKWERTGETIDTLTLTPSIAYPCCHLSVENGKVLP